MLEAREIPSADRLMSEVEGEVETTDDGVLVIRRIRVTYHLQVAEGKEEVARRVHEIHREKCPVYRTVKDCIEVTTELELKRT